MALIEMVLECQPYIPGPPQGKQALWNNAVKNDGVTTTSWRDTWIRQTEENSKSFDFSANSAMACHHKARYQPVIVAGSGPSLKKNWQMLLPSPTEENRPGRCGIKMVSCLHNFGFMEDRDLMGPDDYYITLDAGEITLSEVTEGGEAHDDDWYWERTKDRTLIAYHAAYPAMLRKWKGKILWFTTPTNSHEMGQELAKFVNYTKVPVLNVGGAFSVPHGTSRGRYWVVRCRSLSVLTSHSTIRGSFTAGRASMTRNLPASCLGPTSSATGCGHGRAISGSRTGLTIRHAADKAGTVS